uniref:EamA domain-containing protein n=1 Tax=Steinernema glaseri TaxID=37863 RepID=A0A1I7YJS6_9BILA
MECYKMKAENTRLVFRPSRVHLCISISLIGSRDALLRIDRQLRVPMAPIAKETVSAEEERLLAADSSLPSSTPEVHKKLTEFVVPMNMEVRRSRTPSALTSRTTILVWLTLQNSVHTLLIRYSRAREVEDMFFSSVAVFFTEILKAIICLWMILHEEEGVRGMIRSIRQNIIEDPMDTLKTCVPAIIYTVQNNLFYLAASHLEAATFMITSQMKIFTTAIFSVLLLRRSLARAQWFALAILFVGPEAKKKDSGAEQNPIIGLTAVMVACCLSGFAGVYFEKILKSASPVSLWVRNVQMGLFAMPASLVACLIQDGAAIASRGMLFGFDAVVWLTVFWYCIGGLSVAVCIKTARPSPRVACSSASTPSCGSPSSGTVSVDSPSPCASSTRTTSPRTLPPPSPSSSVPSAPCTCLGSSRAHSSR